MSLGNDELVVIRGDRPGEIADVYALSSLRCGVCESVWKTYRQAGSSLHTLRCPSCGRRKVEYYEGEPSTARPSLLN